MTSAPAIYSSSSLFKNLLASAISFLYVNKFLSLLILTLCKVEFDKFDILYNFIKNKRNKDEFYYMYPHASKSSMIG